jgi:hypothetical protein
MRTCPFGEWQVRVNRVTPTVASVLCVSAVPRMRRLSAKILAVEKDQQATSAVQQLHFISITSSARELFSRCRECG